MALHDLAGQLLEMLAVAEAYEPEDGEEEAPDEVQSEVAEPSLSERHLALAFVAGYLLMTRYVGWKVFCDRLHVPPFLLWPALPGYERLERAWKVPRGWRTTPRASAAGATGCGGSGTRIVWIPAPPRHRRPSPSRQDRGGVPGADPVVGRVNYRIFGQPRMWTSLYLP
jgi:hypothetical protein